MRTLLYEAANVMLTRYKGHLKLKDWAFAIAKRSTMRKARIALARRTRQFDPKRAFLIGPGTNAMRRKAMACQRITHGL